MKMLGKGRRNIGENIQASIYVYVKLRNKIENVFMESLSSGWNDKKQQQKQTKKMCLYLA